MGPVCLHDCVFVPAPQKYTVIDTMKRELELIERGVRNDTTYDHVTTPTFDPEFYLSSGYKYVPIAEGKKPIDLAIEAVDRLIDRNKLDINEIDALIYYDAIPWAEDVTINMPSCIAQKFGMDHLKYCSHITQRNCTSGLAAIEAAYNLMLARPEINSVVVTGGDCVDTHSGEPRVVRNLIFGDAGSAALISREGGPIYYIRSRFIPKGGHRYYEKLEVLQELSMKGFKWSFEELEKAFETALIKPDEVEYIVTNSPPFNHAMDSKAEYPSSKRKIIVDNVRENALTTAHIAMGCLEKVINSSSGKPAIIHATGLGTNLSTMIFSPKNNKLKLREDL